MKYKKTNAFVINKISVMLLVLALCMSLVMPMAGINVYAGNEDKSVAAEEIQKDADTKESTKEADTEKTGTDTSGSEKKAKTAKIQTTITGYQTSYNKRYNQDLLIEADITPADGRDVQLQRYNSEEDNWTTILTASPAPDPVTEPEENSEETAAQAEVTEQAAGSGEAETAAADTASAAGAAENVADTGVALSNDPATLTEEDGVAHVTFNIPQEERQKTTSTWRIHINGTKKGSAASSEKITVTTRNLEKISLSARAACVYRIDGDGQGTMIYSKNSSTQLAQASTTKLMTAVLLMESGLIDSTTMVSAHAAATPYGSGHMAVGDIYNTRDLLYAMLLPSSNDAATAVAERVGGTEGAFVNMMNAKAYKLGLTRTHFCNPHGLDADGHYTTAKELAILTAYAYTFPEIRDCWATQYKSIRSLEKGRRWNLWSTNAIFGYISNFLGGKTGTEDNAGCCFTGVYTFNGDTYVTVVLGSGYGFSRWSDTKRLHGYIQDYAQSHY